MNIIEFKEKANLIHNNFYNYDNVSFTRVTDKVEIICPIHGSFMQRVNSHLSGYRCKRCSSKNSQKNKRIPKEEYLKLYRIEHGDKYDYSISNFKNDDIDIICPIHGVFSQSKKTHRKSGCPKCGILSSNENSKIGLAKFIEVSSKIYNNKYDYSKSVYTYYNKKIIIICPIHGEFSKEASLHMKGSGCPKCSYIETGLNQRLTTKSFIDRAQMIHGNKYDYSKSIYVGIDKYLEIICPIHGSFMQRPDNHFSGSGCKRCTNVTSIPEKEIHELIPDSILNTRKIISNEIDIYSEKYKFGIEYDGVLWHSIGTTFPNNVLTFNKNKHLVKTKECEDLNIQLFHIFSNEWLDPIKKKIWKSMINYKINNISSRIYARKCSVEEIDTKDARIFLDNNHLQGYANSSIKIGLKYNGNIISVMTIGKPRFNSDYEYEIIRMASTINSSIVGGASKMLKYFERKYKPKSIISYANRRWSTDIDSQSSVYKHMGFKFLYNSGINHFYVKGENLYPRQMFQKHKQALLLDSFDPSKSALQNMYNNNYRVLYDCGNKVYVKILE